MVYRRIFIVISLLVLFTEVESQSLRLGLRIEPSILFMEDKNKSVISFTPYSFYFNSIVAITNWLTIEVRPGLFLASQEFSGFELGAFAKLNILPECAYIVAGLNNHSNSVSGSNSGGSYAKRILFKGIGIGFQKDSKLNFDLMYYWTNDKEYGYSRRTDSSGLTESYSKMINGILKIGFSLSWNIF